MYKTFVLLLDYEMNLQMEEVYNCSVKKRMNGKAAILPCTILD